MQRRAFLRFLPLAAAVPFVGTALSTLAPAEPEGQTALPLIEGQAVTLAESPEVASARAELQAAWDAIATHEARLTWLEESLLGKANHP
jgi:hypothetical protein